MHVALALLLVPLLALTSPWSWPVDPPHTVLRPYVAPQTPYSAGHRGVDIAAPGATVYAPADGMVHYAGMVVDRPVLSIEHAGGVLTSYEPVASPLKEGESVKRGQAIGTALAGHCASVCLHFGVRIGGEYASPLAWLGGIGRAVLLPTRGGSTSLARALAHGRESRIRVNPRKSVGERSPLHLRRDGAPRSVTAVTSCSSVKRVTACY